MWNIFHQARQVNPPIGDYKSLQATANHCYCLLGWERRGGNAEGVRKPVDFRINVQASLCPVRLYSWYTVLHPMFVDPWASLQSNPSLPDLHFSRGRVWTSVSITSRGYSPGPWESCFVELSQTKWLFSQNQGMKLLEQSCLHSLVLKPKVLAFTLSGKWLWEFHRPFPSQVFFPSSDHS